MDQLASKIWEITNTHGHQGIELEFRVGHMLGHGLGGGFSPNIGKDAFYKLKRTLDASPKFKIMDIETIEKIGDVKHVTTVSIVDSDVSNPPPPSFCMTKTKLFQTEFSPMQERSPYTIRVGLALEKVVPLKPVNAKLTRHKKRRRYMWSSWAFDLTEVVSNGDLDTEETFEIEVELLDTEVLFEKPMDVVADWGIQLVNDLVNLLAAGSGTE